MRAYCKRPVNDTDPTIYTRLLPNGRHAIFLWREGTDYLDVLGTRKTWRAALAFARRYGRRTGLCYDSESQVSTANGWDTLHWNISRGTLVY